MPGLFGSLTSVIQASGFTVAFTGQCPSLFTQYAERPGCAASQPS